MGTQERAAHTEERLQSLLEDLRFTKLPRQHRDAEDAMHWAADEIERLNELTSDLLASLIAILDCPYPEYDNATLGKARAAIAKATGAL